MEKLVLTTAAANGPPSPPHLVGRQQVDGADTRRRTSADGADGPCPVTCSAPQAGRLGRRMALSHGLAHRPRCLNEKQLRHSYIFPADSAGDGKGLAQEVSVFDSASKKKTAARAALVGRY